jgi:hypothetical protein
MTISRSAIRLVLGFGAILAVAASAKAQTSHLRFVASTGSDANSCLTAATACRTLQQAVDLVTAGGEVRVLDSFNYGPLTITKSVTVSADGATVLTGISINNADAVVTLRGLFLYGRGLVGTGINIVNAAAVHIVDCESERFTGNGIRLVAGAELFIAETVLRDNGSNGLLVNAAAKVTIEDSRVENNGVDGVAIVGATSTITRSVTSGNGASGIYQSGGRMNVTWTTAANNANSGYWVDAGGQMTVEFSVARGNVSIGQFVGAGSTGRISNSVVTNNAVGLANNGTLYTRQNNTVAGNTTANTQGMLTLLTGI